MAEGMPRRGPLLRSRRAWLARKSREYKAMKRFHKPKCTGTVYPLTGLCVADCGVRRGDQFCNGDLEDLARVERAYPAHTWGCSDCCLMFDSEQEYREHCGLGVSMPEYLCQECAAPFAYQSLLLTHIKEAHPYRPSVTARRCAGQDYESATWDDVYEALSAHYTAQGCCDRTLEVSLCNFHSTPQHQVIRDLQEALIGEVPLSVLRVVLGRI